MGIWNFNHHTNSSPFQRGVLSTLTSLRIFPHLKQIWRRDTIMGLMSLLFDQIKSLSYKSFAYLQQFSQITKHFSFPIYLLCVWEWVCTHTGLWFFVLHTGLILLLCGAQGLNSGTWAWCSALLSTEPPCHLPPKIVFSIWMKKIMR